MNKHNASELYIIGQWVKVPFFTHHKISGIRARYANHFKNARQTPQHVSLFWDRKIDGRNDKILFLVYNKGIASWKHISWLDLQSTKPCRDIMTPMFAAHTKMQAQEFQ